MVGGMTSHARGGRLAKDHELRWNADRLWPPFPSSMALVFLSTWHPRQRQEGARWSRPLLSFARCPGVRVFHKDER